MPVGPFFEESWHSCASIHHLPSLFFRVFEKVFTYDIYSANYLSDTLFQQNQTRGRWETPVCILFARHCMSTLPTTSRAQIVSIRGRMTTQLSTADKPEWRSEPCRYLFWQTPDVTRAREALKPRSNQHQLVWTSNYGWAQRWTDWVQSKLVTPQST